MKRMYYLECWSHDHIIKYYVYRCGRSGYNVTLFPARATLFDTYELASSAQKHFLMFDIQFVDICL